MAFAQKLIEDVLNVLIAAGALVLAGLAAVVIGRALIITLPVAVRGAWTLGAALGAALAGLMRHAFALLIASVRPVILPALCVGVEVGGLAYTLPACWHAFGDDVPALIPAAVISLLPLAAVLVYRQSWGGLLLAGGVTFATGAVIGSVPAPARVVLIAATIGGLIFYSLKLKGQNHDEQQERQSVGVAVDPAPAGVQHVSESGLDPVHDGR